MKLVVWLSVLTEHQVHTLQHLSRFLSEPIEYVVGAHGLEERAVQGWPDVENSQLLMSGLPSEGWFNFGKEILKRTPNAIHMFGGLWADKRLFPLIVLAQRSGCQTALMMEPFVDSVQSYFGRKAGLADWCKRWLRPVAYKFAGKLLASKLCAAFAISEKAFDQLRWMGVPESRIYSFGYFVPPIQCDHGPKSVADKEVIRLVFVGSLIERKGLSVLLDAMDALRKNAELLSLDIYGSGNVEDFDFKVGNVSYSGVIPFGGTQKVVADYDLLVLPSLHDGWGVVVNEALLQGVPVLVSDACGAKALIEMSGAGAIFKAGSKNALVEVLTRLTHQPTVLYQWRAAARLYRESITPKVAGRYLYQSLAHALDESGFLKPEPEWGAPQRAACEH